jgi:hypothetical protein
MTPPARVSPTPGEYVGITVQAVAELVKHPTRLTTAPVELSM